jgi:hypothetical protein
MDVSSGKEISFKIEEVLRFGLPIDQIVDGSNTLLHLSVIHGLSEAVLKLLIAWANPLIENKYGESCVDIAKRTGNQSVLHLLSRRLFVYRRLEEQCLSSGGVFSCPLERDGGDLISFTPLTLGLVYDDYIDWTPQMRIVRTKVSAVNVSD